MFKKSLILFTLLTLIFSLSLTVAHASDIIASGECGENATWTLDSDGLLTISGTGGTNTYVDSNGYRQKKAPWAEYTVKKVVINEGITFVQYSAFADNKDLESVTLPETVYSIGDSAFSGCENLKEVNFPEKIINPHNKIFGLHIYYEDHPKIGPNSFSSCTSLENITIPDGFEEIYAEAFSGCTSLESVTLSDDITYIESLTFSGCSKLKNIKIPENLNSIRYHAFEGCSELEEIKLPENLERIYNGAFSGCSKLEKINIPKTVAFVGPDAFDGTKWYENQPDGVIYINNVLYDYKGEMPENTQFVIPKKITMMLPDALKGQENLKSVVIGEGITRIENSSFEGCTNLESVKMTDYVTSIGEYAFKDCTSLKTVKLSEKISEIGKGAFSNCKSLEKIVLPENMTDIGRLMFEYCENLKYVKLPSNYTPRKNDWLLGTTLRMGMFKGCTSLEEIVIPEGFEVIEYTAFLDCVNLKKITLPASLKVIENCFYNCHNITDVYYNGSKNTWNNIQTDVSNTSFTTAKVHFGYKYYSNTEKINYANNDYDYSYTVKIDNDNNIIVADRNKYIGENVLYVFMKENEIVKINKAVFKNGKAEVKMDDDYDEVRVYVYDKLTSPKFDLYEKLKL
mgnify:CR=1 FL=1